MSAVSLQPSASTLPPSHPPPTSAPSPPRPILRQPAPPRLWQPWKAASFLTRRQQVVLAVVVPIVLALLASALMSERGGGGSQSPLMALLRRVSPFTRRPSRETASAGPPTWSLVNNTAEGVALLRYLASKDPACGIEPSEAVALEMLLPPHLTKLGTHPNTRAALRQGALPGVYEAVVARTRKIDDVMDEVLAPKKTGKDKGKPSVEQIVVLGAGSDTRGLRYAPLLAKEGVRVFEVDLPDIQARKQERLAEALRDERIRVSKGDLQAALDNIRYVPVNLTAAAAQHAHTKTGTQHPGASLLPSLWSGLKEAGYSDTKPTLFIMEGLTAYLPSAVVNDTLRALHHHAPPGSVLVVDFFEADPACKEAEEMRVMLEALEGMEEPVLFMLETDVKGGDDWKKAQHRDVVGWLDKSGWHLVELEGPEELGKKYLNTEGKGAEKATESAEKVVCYEHVATARNKPAIEVEIDVIEP